MLGADPFAIETLWRNVYGRGYSQRPDISLMGVLSGLEMAMWDIIGKAVGKPVYALLGGKVHEKLRTYTYLYPDANEDAYADSPVYSDPDAAAKRALEYAAMGFTAVKFDPGRALFDLRSAPTKLGAAGAERGFLPAHPRGGGDALRSVVRHARTVHGLRRASDSRKSWSPTRRFGSRSRRRRKCRRRWRKSRRRQPFRSRPASG